MTARAVGRKRPSISDVASHAGVSRAAVSKVIRNAYGVSPQMRAKVESSIDELAYRPYVAARAMRGSSFSIGFEIPHLGNEFFSQISDGTAKGLNASGYQVLIAPSMGAAHGPEVLEALADRQVDGIIAIASEVDADWLENLATTVPLVIIGRHEDSVGYDTVTGDDVAGANLAMDHLEELGHTRIVHLTIHPEMQKSPHSLRLETYTARMAAKGLAPTFATADGEDAAYQTALELMHDVDPPTAIFAGYDTLAIGALRATAEMAADGAPPVAVIGYDGIDLAAHPLISLTTIDQFGRQMGQDATKLLMERIRDGRTDAVHHQLTPALRARRSTQRR